MRKTFVVRAVPMVFLAAGAGNAAASGFQLLEQNASGIGNAYAGSAAVAENASTIFFNPAGMTQLKAREVSFGVAAVKPGFEFSNRGSRAGVLAGDGEDAGGWEAVPNAYLSWALTPDLYAGVGLSAPFGLVTDYDERWVGAAQSVSFEIRTYNINPSIAYRVNDKVSIGAGLSWQRMEAEYERIAGVSGPFALSTAKLDVDGDAWGWNIGALFTLSPNMKVGVSYRSKVDHELDGKVKVSGPSPLLNAGGTSKADVDVELPETVILSVAQRLDDRWEMLGDVSWTGWSSVDRVDIVRTSGPLAGSVAQTLKVEFKDTWRIALGANYQLNDAWRLKFGIARDQSPVKDRQRRLVALPDQDRTWLAFGAQWKISQDDTLDFGAAYIYVPETKIDNDQSPEGRGRVTGKYDSRVWLVGAQYSMSF